MIHKTYKWPITPDLEARSVENLFIDFLSQNFGAHNWGPSSTFIRSFSLSDIPAASRRNLTKVRNKQKTN